MYDPKTIRRRRAVLALLVVSSLVLLTASFGGSGGVGSVQRGVFEIVSPVQDVASRSLKPFRDLFGWFGDTWRAKGENGDLRKSRDELRLENAALDARLRNARTAAGILEIDQAAGLQALDPVTARVIGASPTLLFQSVNVNKGSSDGVRVGRAVVGDGGLVGVVEAVGSGASKVTLLTDSSFGAEVQVASTGLRGTLRASGGSPEDLVMKATDTSKPISVGAMITTRGTDPGSRLSSLYPPDIPVGTVTRIEDAGTDTQKVHVRPFVDVTSLDHVQILRRDPGRLP